MFCNFKCCSRNSNKTVTFNLLAQLKKPPCLFYHILNIATLSCHQLKATSSQELQKLQTEMRIMHKEKAPRTTLVREVCTDH